MSKQSVIHATYVIERSFPNPPERVFAAFSNPSLKRRWYADGHRKAEEFTMDFQVGGKDHTMSLMGADTPFPGTPLTNDTVYQDIVPNRRIILAYTMAIGGRRISASLVTIELLPTTTGTDLIFTEQGAFFENSGGPKMREEGWRALLVKLAEELGR